MKAECDSKPRRVPSTCKIDCFSCPLITEHDPYLPYGRQHGAFFLNKAAGTGWDWGTDKGGG